MQLNRFWTSVWGTFAFLVSVGLVNYLFLRLAGLVGLASQGVSGLLSLVFSSVIPVVAALLWMDWRWNWKPEHIGMPRQASGALWVLLGLAVGGGAAFLMHAVSAMLTGASLVPAMPALTGGQVLVTLLGLLPIVGTEMIFRGAAISRYQAELTPREALLAGPLTPFLWLFVTALLGRVVGLGVLRTGVDPSQPWTFLFVIALALLYLRTDSVWLSIGIHMGVVGALGLFGLSVSANGGLLVWALVALALLAMEWLKLQRMPKRVQPRNTYRGGTIRGPWGPH